MRIGPKLLLSFFSVAFLVLITGGVSYYFSNEIKNDLISENLTTSAQLQTLTEMTGELQNSLLYTRNFLTESAKKFSGDQSLSVSSQIRQSRQIVMESLDQFSESLDNISEIRAASTSAGEISSVNHTQISELSDSLKQSFSYYNSLVRQLFELDESPEMSNEIFNITIEPYFRNTLLPILQDLRAANYESIDLQMEVLQIRADETVTKIVLYTVFAFLISLILASLVYRSISKPISELTAVAEEMGSGDLSQRIELNTNDELAELAKTLNGMAENLNKSMVSRSYVNNIIQSMGDMLIVTNPDGEISLANIAVSKNIGYNPTDLVNTSFWHLIAGEEREDFKRNVKNNSTPETPVEIKLVTNSGETIPVNLSYSTLSKNGEGTDMIFVASDISLLKEAEKKISDSLEEKNVLLSEIHHRVKNNLAVITGLLELQTWNLKSEEGIGILRDTQLRIKSIALVHEKLYKTENFANVHIDDYIEDLTKGIEDSFNDPTKNIIRSVKCENIKMNINQAIPFSLLLNEVIVNAYQHAFGGISEGEIKIELKRISDDLIQLQVEDNGVGLKGDPLHSKSQGMKLISTLSSQLSGKFEIKNAQTKGTVFIAEFPA